MNLLIKIFALILVYVSCSYAQASLNMTLLSQKNDHTAGGIPQDFHYSSVWGWTSPSGREYAIIGYSNGTAIYDITNAPASVILCDTLPGPASFYNYREFAVVDHYLYIVSREQEPMRGCRSLTCNTFLTLLNMLRTGYFRACLQPIPLKVQGIFCI
jgi:hypothetical protein